VLLDEIEKAHPDVYHMLLQVMDDGHLTDSYGRKVDFKNVVLIMTSNVSARTIEKNTAIGFQRGEADTFEKIKENVMNELKRTFNPEFLNRIDESVMFHSLNLDHMRHIVDILLGRLNVSGSALVVTMGSDHNVVRAASNLKKIYTLPVNQINAEALLSRDLLIMTAEAAKWAEATLAVEPHGRRGRKFAAASGSEEEPAAIDVDETGEEPAEPAQEEPASGDVAQEDGNEDGE